jgi:hypothetical protein
VQERKVTRRSLIAAHRKACSLLLKIERLCRDIGARKIFFEKGDLAFYDRDMGQ